MIIERREYQENSIDRAVSYFKGKSKKPEIQVLPTGSGKSVCLARTALELDGDTLIFQPSKEILEQNLSKIQHYGFDAGVYSASLKRKDIDKITLATIGSVKGKAHLFQGVKNIMVDECFPSGSMVDGKPIESLVVGDFVKSFNHDKNKVELKRVVRLFKKKVDTDMMKIKFTDKSEFVCTINHPIYTNELGYIPAYMLSLIDSFALTSIKEGVNEPQNNLSLRDLRNGVPKEKPYEKCNSILFRRVQERNTQTQTTFRKCQVQYLSERNHNYGISENELYENRQGLLFSKMQQGSSTQIISRKREKDGIQQNFERTIVKENEGKQPYVDAWRKGKNDKFLKRKMLFAFNGGQRKSFRTAKNTFGSSRASNGSCYKNRKSKNDLQNTKLLQGRFGLRKKEVGNRGRWGVTQITEGSKGRQEERIGFRAVGVESFEIYQQGSIGKLGMLRTTDFVYNIEVEDNHNYFVSNILVHNCHGLSAKSGMYFDFFKEIDAKIMGYTATPYRLSTDGYGGSILKFLTRTRPRIFTKVNYLVQTQELFEKGYLSKLEYYPVTGFDRNQMIINSTGAGFTDASVLHYYNKTGFNARIARAINRLIELGRRGILTFVPNIQSAEEIASMVDGAVVLTGDTPTDERKRILEEFKSGIIKCVINFGVLVVGFDYPELDTVVVARPTRSLAVWYQMIGRVVRPHISKKSGWVIDMCGNLGIFGKMEDLYLDENGGKWIVTSKGKQLTNRYFGEIHGSVGR